MKLIIEPFISSATPRSKVTRTQRYRVWLNAELILESSANPEYEAARVLTARGVRDRVEVWDRRRPFPRSVITDVAKVARTTILESETTGPRRTLYQEFTGVGGTQGP